MEEKEEWRSIAGFSDYSVSNFGRIRRDVKRTSATVGRILRQSISRGYNVVSLSSPGKKKIQKTIHRIVAEVFLDNPLGLPVVNHLDGNKLNNTSSNLEFCTVLRNAQHASATGLYAKGDSHPARVRPEYLARGEKNGNSRLTEETVLAIRRQAGSGEPGRKLASDFSVSQSLISQVVRRVIWKHLP